ncbi:type II toxin-antitoxin system VapC family toxin [Halotia branconii]|uniref:PIN domain-containing protein n=1 Tax=Halotia branconii CENA392 TaxID=1539056 RepID=A0AAJ6NVS7_9CYAN|nr:PIN domain-containing protein [Halotia branconii]WGV27515.1 PIN domain-containing protein [Halotia branconii CENA392]
MPYMADTNILLRFISPSDPNHIFVRDAIYSLLLKGEEVCYTSQNLGEFWNVCTRPITARSGFGLSIEETNRRAQVIERYFTFLPDSEAIHLEWRRLVVDYRVSGVKVHDTRIVASMYVHGVTHILTFNTDDFTRYSEITAIHLTVINP